MYVFFSEHISSRRSSRRTAGGRRPPCAGLLEVSCPAAAAPHDAAARGRGGRAVRVAQRHDRPRAADWTCARICQRVWLRGGRTPGVSQPIAAAEHTRSTHAKGSCFACCGATASRTHRLPCGTTRRRFSLGCTVPRRRQHAIASGGASGSRGLRRSSRAAAGCPCCVPTRLGLCEPGARSRRRKAWLSLVPAGCVVSAVSARGCVCTCSSMSTSPFGVRRSRFL